MRFSWMLSYVREPKLRATLWGNYAWGRVELYENRLQVALESPRAARRRHMFEG